MKLKIFALTHKEFESEHFDPKYMEKVYSYNCNNCLNDFSDKYYAELYMIHDIYQNIHKYVDDDTRYIGFCHYRRFFDIDYDNIIKFLDDNKVIMLYPEKFDMPVALQYSRYHDLSGTQIKIIDDIVNKTYNSYYTTYKNFFYTNNEMSLCNMFICPLYMFYEWHDFIFNVLNHFTKTMNFKNYNDVYDFIKKHPNNFTNYIRDENDERYEKSLQYVGRIAAFLGERLTNVYFLNKCKDTNIIYVDKFDNAPYIHGQFSS